MGGDNENIYLEPMKCSHFECYLRLQQLNFICSRIPQEYQKLMKQENQHLSEESNKIKTESDFEDSFLSADMSSEDNNLPGNSKLDMDEDGHLPDETGTTWLLEMLQIMENANEIIQKTKEFLIKGMINAAADCLMRLVYDYKLPAQVQRINRKIIQEVSDLAKRFLDTFRNQNNREIISKLADDHQFIKSNPMLGQLFS